MKTKTQYITLKELCETLSISLYTGKNWIKLGKLQCQHKEGREVYFSTEYAEEIRQRLKTGEIHSLKSRRNKKYTSGNELYSSYVSDKSTSVNIVQKLLSIIELKEISLTDETLQFVLAECSIQLLLHSCSMVSYDKRAQSNTLIRYAKGGLSFGAYNGLLDDLIADKTRACEFVEQHPEIFELSYTYECREDILGLLYISCKNIGSRKSTGTYYTPTTVVCQLVENLEVRSDGMSILDPCCGTGNFLLQLPDIFSVNDIYGSDIDEIAVKLTRINMALKYRPKDVYVLYSNIQVKNFLIEDDNRSYDYIVGNPPWGSEFLPEECGYLRKNYKVTVGKSVEAYDVFVEKALSLLKKEGVMAFVLPESILNVAAHMPVRELIAKVSNIQYLSYLGEVFYKVQCPSIILKLCKMGKPMSTVGMKIRVSEKSYVINIERKITPQFFNFKVTDEEYMLIQKIKNVPNPVYLKENAIFALGIVTGDNKKHVVSHSDGENEPVLRGRDVDKYSITEGGCFIKYIPENFQQTAPSEYYRAKEKLIYRFIGKKLIFAYDDKGRLTLNSCNVLIPKIEGVHIKYIMAVLNSDAMQFFYEKEFGSTKILRSHLEHIPIPRVNEETQYEIVKLVDRLLECDRMRNIEEYNELIKSINSKIKVILGLY